MITVTLKQIEEGTEALKKLGGNAKIQTVLYFRVLKACKLINSELEAYLQARKAAFDRHTEWFDRKDANGNIVKQAEYPSRDERQADEAETKQLQMQEVQLDIKPIEWKMIQEEIDKKTIDFPPLDALALDWLIEGLPDS